MKFKYKINETQVKKNKTLHAIGHENEKCKPTCRAV